LKLAPGEAVLIPAGRDGRPARHPAEARGGQSVLSPVMTLPEAAADEQAQALCRNHPSRPATFVCRKYGLGYCDECCACPHPETYCQYRTQCLIREVCREGAGAAMDP
jgi:hypothetical protein